MRFSLALVALLLASLSASAHAQIAEGRRRLEMADFTRAVRAFDRAERARTLSRDELLQIYEGRAMARWATGDSRRAGRDLAALAELDPHHGFPPEAPPDLGEAFDAAAREGGLALALTFEDETGATTMTVDTQRDGAGLVRSLRTHVRVGTGAWISSTESTVHLVVPEGQPVEAWVEAIGPGGAVLTTAGTESAPVVHGGGAVHELVPPEPTPPPVLAATTQEEEHHGSDEGLWIGLGVGAGVLVIAAVVVGVVLGTSGGTSDHTQPDVPVVRF